MVTLIPIQKPETCTGRSHPVSPHRVQNQTQGCTEISYNTENSQDFVCHAIQFILPAKVGMHGTVHVKSAWFYNFHSYHKKYHLKKKNTPGTTIG